MRTIIVCGGRNFGSRERVFKYLDSIHAKNPIGTLVHGGCSTGADQFADAWAKTRGVYVKVYVADWQGEGRAAGPNRNERMARDSGAELLVAFSGGRGTIDMIRRATNHGMRVRFVDGWCPVTAHVADCASLPLFDEIAREELPIASARKR